VVARDRDGSDLTRAHAVVDLAGEGLPLAEAQPAHARRQPFEGDAFLGGLDPSGEGLVFTEEVGDEVVGDGDVVLVAGEGDPAERAPTLTEHRTHVGLHEAGVGEGLVVAGILGLPAEVVAVVEDDAALVLEGHQRLAVVDHRGPSGLLVLGGVLLA
jgi:hypothetical protein